MVHTFKDTPDDQVINRIFYHIDFSGLAYKKYNIKSPYIPYSFKLRARKSVLSNSLVRLIDVNGVAMHKIRLVTFFFFCQSQKYYVKLKFSRSVFL
jgi:hypothetical protein